jgi:DNA-binding transcriptional LysR family regulator
MSPSLNLKQLRHFVAVAEERHFTRAAARLGIAQPPLSQSIARLEGALGFRLLERSRGGVTLTPAGEAMFQEVRAALRQLDSAVRVGAQINEGRLRSIAIGFVGVSLEALLPAVFREVKQILPDTEVRLHTMSTKPQREAILNGTIDLGFLFPDPGEPGELCSVCVDESHIAVAAPEDWPLAKKPQLTLADIADQPLFMFAPERRPELYSALMAEFRREGFTPHIELELPDTYTSLRLVAAGLGVGIMYETNRGSNFNGVRFVPLVGLGDHLKMRLSMAWLANPSPGLAKVIEHLSSRFAVEPR